MNISACIITNNNRGVLNAIQSVKKSCNEIILVETSGKNDFQNELNNLGVKLYWKLFEDDFSAVRNYSIEQAAGEYILIIDSDEVLNTEIKYLDSDYDYYFCKVINNGLYHYSVKLFKNIPELRYYNRIHENVSYQNFKGCLSDIEYLHTGYDTDEQVRVKQERNLKILEKDVNNPGRNYYFLCAYYYKKEIDNAIEYGIKSLNDNIGNEIKANACLMLNDLYKHKNDLQNALIYLSKSFEYLPEQSRGRIEFINLLEQYQRKEDLITELNIISEITKKKKSFLPNDVYLTEQEINEKLIKANLIN